MTQLRIYTSEDADAILFARMLCLSLREQGYRVLMGGDPSEAALLLLDADALSDEQISALLSRNDGVLYATRSERLADRPAAALTILRPFSMRQFLSSLRQLTEQSPKEAIPVESSLSPADELLFSEQGVSFRKTPLHLTTREEELLRYLYRYRGTPRSREEILRDVWQYAANASPTNVVDVYIRYLRAKIDQAFDVRLIRAVRGQGYVLG